MRDVNSERVLKIIEVAARFGYSIVVAIGEVVLLLKATFPWSRPRFMKQQKGKFCSAMDILSNTNLPAANFWMHATSLGEAALAAVVALRIRTHDPEATFIITVATQGGYDEAIRKGVFQRVLFFPPDLGFLMKRLIAQVKPQALIIIDGDYWLNQIAVAKQMGVAIIVANAKVSERSARNYARFSLLSRPTFKAVSIAFAQSELYATRLISLGLDPNGVSVVGSLKVLAQSAPLTKEERLSLRTSWQIPFDLSVLVLGSVHPKEISDLCDMLSVLSRNTKLLVLCVPRHPDRFPSASFSEQISRHYNGEVRVIQKLGILQEIYSFADLAFVGGTFCDVNGHNLIEPAQYGLPVVFGPNVNTQLAMRESILKFQAGMQAETGVEAGEQIRKLLDDDVLRESTALRAKEMIEALRVTGESAVKNILHLATKRVVG